MKQALPIDRILPEVVASLETQACLVLKATPGSGKTTRVPPALLNATFSRPRREILVLEPRRLAAKWAARRVADELGESIGDTVGYQFRFENVGGPRTRLRFLTEGLLLRRLLGDPDLREVSAVILDEFHERHLQSDLALAYLRRLQLTRRPDLRLVVMSATLETDALASYLGDCPVLDVEARQHPVEIEYLRSAPSKPLDSLVHDAVAATADGDVLVFLPGMSEIRRAEAALRPLAQRRSLRVFPLHGDLSREEQDSAVLPVAAPIRKVILSTNIAETSLTIPGITHVVDSGLQRLASHSWWSGIPALKTRPISRASAIQRAGRAGRTGPGKCLRLYTKGDFDGRAAFEIPEIRRLDLAQAVLDLKALGVQDLSTFPWFEAPSVGTIEASLQLLHRLAALTEPRLDSHLTKIGQQMARVPAHPRISKLVIEADQRGARDSIALLAALLSEGELDSSQLDIRETLQRSARGQVSLNVRRAIQQFSQLFASPGGAISTRDESQIAKAILAAFPDRVARKRVLAANAQRNRGNQVELVFSAGGSARADESVVLQESDWFVVLDAQERQFLDQRRSENIVRAVCPIQPEWLLDLEPAGVAEVDLLEWDESRGQLACLSRMVYGELTLSESKGSIQDWHAAVIALLKYVFRVDADAAARFTPHEWLQAFEGIADPETFEAALARLALFRKRYPDSGIAEVEQPGGLWPVIEGLLHGKTRLAEIKEIDWPAQIVQAASASDPGLLARIERELPLHFTFPHGRRAKIQYRFGQAPWLESRLQDFFGLKQGPSLLGGTLPLTLHLLAPNQRAVQVTTDLAGFWNRAYRELRGQLSRRYPRHSWPEDPVSAKPPERR